MIRKLTLAVGFGAGYVLGAKAGTQRYEQIMAKARELAGRPEIQQVTDNLSQTVGQVTEKAKDTLNDTVEKVSGGGSSSSAPAATSDAAFATTTTTTTVTATDPDPVVDLTMAASGLDDDLTRGTGTGPMPGAAPSSSI